MYCTRTHIVDIHSYLCICAFRMAHDDEIPSDVQGDGQEEARHLGLFFFREDDAAAMVATVRLHLCHLQEM